jgi:hypothetical protein
VFPEEMFTILLLLEKRKFEYCVCFAVSSLTFFVSFYASW